MLFDFLRSLLIFQVVAFGLAWPCASRLRLTAAERLVATVALSLVGTFLVAWVIYVFAWPAPTLIVLPAAAAIGLWLGRRALIETWHDPNARALWVGQLLVSAWCVGWLATIESYSGGGWAGDWLEHWERARFFVERGPLDQQFLTIYPLTARPPLANVVTAALLGLTTTDFGHYQLFSALLACLVFLPAALLTIRFTPQGGSGPRAAAVLTALFLVSPLFVENATFAWTKLPTACFILAALYFFLRASDPDAPGAAAPLWSACLAAALLSHYSAGPYAVMLAVGWFAFTGGRRDAAWWRVTAGSALVGAALLIVWFSWAVLHYGVAGTFLSNTSVTTVDTYNGSQVVKVVLNVVDTFLPHFFHASDHTLINQTNPWGALRDAWFLCCQLNLLLALGCVAWVAIGRELWRVGRDAPSATHRFWTWFVAGVVFLGVATHGARDEWGLTHICLQALVLLGIAFLAARWTTLGRGWRIVLVAGASVDFALGIALQFGIQSFRLIRWTSGGRPLAQTIPELSATTAMNLRAKFFNHVQFFGETFGAPLGVIMLLLVAILAIALVRASRRAGPLAPLVPPPPGARPPRDLPLEGLRGLCAISVLYAHAFAPNPVVDPGWSPPAQFWWLNLGYAAVMVFFTLSGYVIGLTTTRPPTGQEVSRYLGRRALRLVPINTFAVLLAWALVPAIGARTVFANLLFLENGEAYPGGVAFELLPNNASLWSLNYEVVCYLAFLVVWLFRPTRLLAWCTLIVIALLSAVGLPDWATVSHFACGGLYWLAGLALAWQTPATTGSRRGNWPAAFLGAFALWSLAPLRTLSFGEHWYALAGVTPASLHRIDFLPACVWLLTAVTGRAPQLQRVVGWFCVLVGTVGAALHLRAGTASGGEMLAIGALVSAAVLHGWRPDAKGLARLAPVGTISFAVYAIALPLQLGQRNLAPAFAGSPLTFTVRLLLLLTAIFGLAWWLERRVSPWLRQRFLAPAAANFPRESPAPLNSVR
jgi:peptidoglycan/LPS O-acetylase OafA/YrhL